MNNPKGHVRSRSLQDVSHRSVEVFHVSPATCPTVKLGGEAGVQRPRYPWIPAFASYAPAGGLRRFLIVLFLYILAPLQFCFITSAYAQAPNLITYQGRLKENNQPVTGNRNVEISLCDALIGGSCHTTGPQSVDISTGLFKTTFAVPADADLSSGNWWLELKVQNTVLTPREQLTSVPYALYSGTASFANNLAAPAGAAGVISSTHVYLINGSSLTVSGAVTAGAFYGDGSGLTGVTGASGTDVTKVLKSGDTMTGRLSAPDYTAVYGVTASSAAFASGIIASSYTATGIGISAARLLLYDNVSISSEASAMLGAGVNVSTNVYILGFSSAAKYFGDGSGLTGLTASAIAPDKIQAGSLNADVIASSVAINSVYSAAIRNGEVTDAKISSGINAAKLTGILTVSSVTAAGPLGISAAHLRLADNVAISSDALAGGILVSSDIYVVGFSSAAKYFGDGSGLTGLTASAIAPDKIQTGSLNTDVIASSLAINSVYTAAIRNGEVTDANISSGINASKLIGILTVSSMTVAGPLGMSAAQLRLADNVAISSDTLAGGVSVSSNIYIVGFSSAAKYYGDGSTLTGVSTNTFKIGDSYGGGIIFWVDAVGKQVLIAATADQSTGIQWSNDTNTTGSNFDGIYAGKGNTVIISTMQHQGNYAAQVCSDYSITLDSQYYDDWYLPSKYELNLLYAQRSVIGGFSNTNYWSSNEYVPTTTMAWYESFFNGNANFTNKPGFFHVRCIRAGPSTSVGNLPTNAETVTNGAYVSSTQTFTGVNVFSSTTSFTAADAILPGVDISSGLIVRAGNVGIGTAAPGAKLEVNGQVKITGGNPGAGKVLSSDGGGLAVWQTITAPGDNLGSHIATTTLNMSGNQIINVSTIVFTGLGGGIVLSPYIDATKNYASKYGIAIGSITYDNYNSGVGVGFSANSNHDFGVGIGDGAFNNYSDGVGVGHFSYENHNYGVGVGNGSSGNNNKGVGVGYGAGYNYNSGVGVGVLAANNQDYAVGIGAYSQNNQTFGSALGAYSYAASSSTALGSNAKANAPASIAIGNGTINDSTGTAAFGIYAINTSSDLIVGGNVGIGTAAPGAKLEVNGQVKITGGNPGAGKVLYSDGSGLAVWQNIAAPGDNLGSHVATTTLNMMTFDVKNAGYITASSMALSGQLIVDSSATVVGNAGFYGKLNVYGDADLKANLTAAGPATFVSSVTVNGLAQLGDAIADDGLGINMVPEPGVALSIDGSAITGGYILKIYSAGALVGGMRRKP